MIKNEDEYNNDKSSICPHSSAVVVVVASISTRTTEVPLPYSSIYDTSTLPQHYSYSYFFLNPLLTWAVTLILRLPSSPPFRVSRAILFCHQPPPQMTPHHPPYYSSSNPLYYISQRFYLSLSCIVVLFLLIFIFFFLLIWLPCPASMLIIGWCWFQSPNSGYPDTKICT